MILHVTDFHANLRWYRWLVSVSSKYELICLTGDMLDLNLQRAPAEQIDVIVPLLKSVEAPLAIVSGNHDSPAGARPQLEHGSWLNEVRGKARWIDGDSFALGRNRFVCIPWQGRLPNSGLDEIWLSHVPPDSATGISRGGAGWGSFDLGEVCRNGDGPRVVLSGHVHDPQMWKAQIGRTWSLNPGCSSHTVQPSYIVIDFDRDMVTFNEASGHGDHLKL
jgi:predicted phosphodiesterase